MPQVAEAKDRFDATKRVSLTKILVTTDFSAVSDRALDYAIALARRYDARIYLAHVITPDPFQFLGDARRFDHDTGQFVTVRPLLAGPR